MYVPAAPESRSRSKSKAATTTSVLDLRRLKEDVHSALKLWHSGSAAGSPLSHLMLFQQIQFGRNYSLRQTTNEILLDAVERLEHDNADGALILRKHYMDDLKVYMIANQMGLEEGTIYNKQRQALEQLAGIVGEMEATTRATLRGRFEARLEQRTYLRLFGVEPHIEHLHERLRQAGPPWLVAVEGMGGIGKTALADALMRRMLETPDWVNFAWVTARHQSLNLGGGLRPVATPSLTTEALMDAMATQLLDPEESQLLSAYEKEQNLRRRLKSMPHLIVVDNLETVADVEHLLGLLRDLAGPSKFVLTTRHSLFDEPDIYHFGVPALAPNHALALIRHEAELRNLPDLATSSDAVLHSIYETVGGNPLALRLVVGQTHIHTLDAILTDLRQAHSSTSESLYTYIYRRVWDVLDEPARRLLLAMPLMAEQGGDLDYLAAISQLAPGDLHSALDRLLRYNLVDATGGVSHRLYTIHGLTRTFLQEQVAKWQQAAE